LDTKLVELRRCVTPQCHDQDVNSFPGLPAARNALLEQRLDGDGLAQWAQDLVSAAALATEFQADVRVGTTSVDWSVDARAAGRPVLLVDVGANALGQASLDQLELRATHVWRDLTRSAAVFEPRPWIGAIRVVEADSPDTVGVERIRRLVTARTLDAACVVVLDRRARAVRSPSAAVSMESFVAALTGRCLVLATGHAAAAR
jgi:hypothetical protein